MHFKIKVKTYCKNSLDLLPVLALPFLHEDENCSKVEYADCEFCAECKLGCHLNRLDVIWFCSDGS